MNKKNQTKLALNILNLFHLENNLKKKNKKPIPIPLNKIKSSISTSLLFLNNNNIKNKVHRP